MKGKGGKLKMLCVGTFCNSVAGRPAVFCGAYLLHPAQLSLTAAPLPGAGGAHQLHRLLRHLASQPAPTPPTFCHLFADDRTAANLGSGKPGWRRPSSMRGIIGPFQHLLLVQKIALLLNALKPPAGAVEALPFFTRHKAMDCGGRGLEGVGGKRCKLLLKLCCRRVPSLRPGGQRRVGTQQNAGTQCPQ